MLCHLTDNAPMSVSDKALNSLSWKDFPKLHQARACLTVKNKDKTLDIVFHSRITAMVATLNFYLDVELSYTWREASVLAAKAAGRSAKFARNIREWLHTYLCHQKLPMHRYGRYHSSILEDEDFQESIQLGLLEKAKDGFICAQDVVDLVSSPELQEKLGTKHGAKKTTISLRTAQHWLKKLDWHYGTAKRGMYIDGHEREDVVKYRDEFIKRWQEYVKRMVLYDNDGNILSTPTGFPVPGGRFHLILVTHDESTFYAHDRRKIKWVHSSQNAVPERKGEGASLMVSDFLTTEWGRLKDDEE
jgi:hypothetical protein